MKKIVFGGIAVLAIATAVAFNVNISSQNEKMSSLSMANVEALAQESSDNKFDYTVWERECTVYVGGAYAKGKEVSCFTGRTHPECASCKL